MTELDLQTIIQRTALAVAEELRQDVAKTPELMTKKELADYLSCDVSKVNRYMLKGMPVEYFGSAPRFRKHSIDRWLSGGLQEVSGQTN